MTASTYKTGTIAIVGRPNVGKSTLVNQLVGQKITITSPKAQTTRQQILGILTTDQYQMIFVDTPGYHLRQAHKINHYMNKAALGSLYGSDLIVWVIQADQWTDEDEALLQQLHTNPCPILLVINKIDLLSDKTSLLPLLEQLQAKINPAIMIPISAKKNIAIEQLKQEIHSRLPIGEPNFPADQVSDKSLRFIAAELIREKLYYQLQDELPYALTVTIEQFIEEPKLTRISANILVDKPSHKGIIIGKQGAKLKSIGKQARLAIEAVLQQKVFLQLWVKVKTGWRDDEFTLRSLGYEAFNEKLKN